MNLVKAFLASEATGQKIETFIEKVDTNDTYWDEQAVNIATDLAKIQYAAEQPLEPTELW